MEPGWSPSLMLMGIGIRMASMHPQIQVLPGLSPALPPRIGWVSPLQRKLEPLSPLVGGGSFIPAPISDNPGLPAEDGSRVIAAAYRDPDLNPGWLYVSADSGAHWMQASAPNNNWFSVASSADGINLAAVASTGSLYTSADGGKTWVSNNVPSQPWFAITSSGDGSKLAAFPGGDSPFPVYLSTDFGRTWEPDVTREGSWASAAFSADGTKLAAAMGGYQAGLVYVQVTQPTLSISSSNGSLMISWPKNVSGFVLEGNSDCRTTNWTRMTNSINVAGEQNQVSVLRTTGNHFYRLKSQ